MVRILVAVAILIAGLSATCSAQLQWPACEKVIVGGFDAAGMGPGIMFRSTCRGVSPEVYFKNASPVLERKRLEWEAVWNALRFPPRVFEYQLVIGSYDLPINVLINDQERPDVEMDFLGTPYVRIARSMTFR